MTSLYVQYGCGLSAPEKWVNFDASPTLVIERLIPFRKRLFPSNVRYGDIVKGLPVREWSCTGIYASHILEHLSLADFDRALANTHRYLKPLGIFRLVVPDLECLAKNYLADQSEDSAIRFIEGTSMGKRHRARGVGVLKEWLGNSAHLWLWDERSLAMKLREHGFKDIRRAQFGDSTDRRFGEVEEAQRFEEAVAMECRK